MDRKLLLTVLFAVAVALAGCAATGSDDTNGGDSLVDNRTAVLAEAGSYTSTWQMEFSEDGVLTGSIVYTHAVDYANERSQFSMLLTDNERVSTDYETFHADGVSYTRYGADEGQDASYQMADAPFAPENTLFPVESSIAGSSDLAAFTAVGTETYDGATVTRYERTDRPAWIGSQGVAQGSGSELTWTEFTYTVLVDQNGLVRSEGWSGEGVTDDGVSQEVAFSYSLSGIGSTVVEDPDWLSAARGQPTP